jgi:hypothetical protein
LHSASFFMAVSVRLRMWSRNLAFIIEKTVSALLRAW